MFIGRRIVLSSVLALATVTGCAAAPDESANASAGAVIEAKVRTCAVDPVNNPFGMRSFVTLSAEDEAIVAQYDVFPSFVGGPVEASVGQTRKLVLRVDSIEEARKALRADPGLFVELTEDGGISFAEWEAVASCSNEPKAKAEPAAPTCEYDSAGGKENPLGMRSFVTITVSKELTTADWAQLPTNVSTTTGVPTTIETVRTLLLPVSTAAAARALLNDLSNDLAHVLLGELVEDYAAIDASLSCK